VVRCKALISHPGLARRLPSAGARRRGSGEIRQASCRLRSGRLAGSIAVPQQPTAMPTDAGGGSSPFAETNFARHRVAAERHRRGRLRSAVQTRGAVRLQRRWTSVAAVVSATCQAFPWQMKAFCIARLHDTGNHRRCAFRALPLRSSASAIALAAEVSENRMGHRGGKRFVRA